MPAASARYATYKGRTYKLLYLGKTKFGERAHLSFTDGSKDFWVSASLVFETSAPAQSSSSSRRQAYSGGSSQHCYGTCPVTGMKCCSANGPCHDCM